MGTTAMCIVGRNKPNIKAKTQDTWAHTSTAASSCRILNDASCVSSGPLPWCLKRSLDIRTSATRLENKKKVMTSCIYSQNESGTWCPFTLIYIVWIIDMACAHISFTCTWTCWEKPDLLTHHVRGWWIRVHPSELKLWSADNSCASLFVDLYILPATDRKTRWRCLEFKHLCVCFTWSVTSIPAVH